jgi:hypothetical protein
MESVIERGQARCPRCVAVADYFFVELGPNLLRYEVNCRRCGETYRETHGPVLPSFVAAVDESLPAPRTPKVPVRERLQSWADTTQRRVAALPATATAAFTRRTMPAWLTLLFAVSRTPSKPERQ